MGELARIVPGLLTSAPLSDWPAIITLHRTRVLVALYPGAVIGYRSAFKGGIPVDDTIHLNYSYSKTVQLPGLKVVLVKSPGKLSGHQPMSERDFYFPSQSRIMLENLSMSRGQIHKSAGKIAVEERLLSICESRGEDALNRLREEARSIVESIQMQRV